MLSCRAGCRPLLAVAVLFWLGPVGCSLVKPAFQVDPCLVDYRDNECTRLRKLNGTRCVEPLNTNDLYKRYLDLASDLADRRVARNEVMDQAMLHCDQVCPIHQAGFVSQSALTSTILGVASVALSAAGAVSTGGATQVLSAASAATQGTDRTLTDKVYHSKVDTAVGAAIDAAQSAKRAQIIASQRLPVETYGIYAGMRDVVEYHELCSFAKGLQFLQDNASGAKDEADKTEAEARKP
ncbi:MAG: hypothetical protein U0807_14210 [Candidatus Binatia bacterium]